MNSHRMSLFGNNIFQNEKPDLGGLSETITRQIKMIQGKFSERYNYILERAKKDFSMVKSKFMEFLESKREFNGRLRKRNRNEVVKRKKSEFRKLGEHPKQVDWTAGEFGLGLEGKADKLPKIPKKLREDGRVEEQSAEVSNRTAVFREPIRVLQRLRGTGNGPGHVEVSATRPEGHREGNQQLQGPALLETAEVSSGLHVADPHFVQGLHFGKWQPNRRTSTKTSTSRRSTSRRETC